MNVHEGLRERPVTEIERLLEAKRKDRKFMERIRKSVERSREILERLRREGD